jgi:archaellum biogenesis ATPase FlaH
MDNKNKNTDILTEALYLSENLGWSIIPVSTEKKPLIEWKKYQEEKSTVEEITDWFVSYPNANIGVVTGKISNLIVVDIDPRHGGTDEELKHLPTVKSATGGGGWHYYFQYKDGVQNRAAIKPGIDIRGEGGYVILPPSLHISGKAYEWIVSPEEASLLDYPYELFQGGETKIGNNDWATILSGSPEGQRNTNATKVIGKLLSAYPEQEWDEFVFPLVRDWNNQNEPPLSLEELESIFNSLIKRELVNREESNLLQQYTNGRAMQWKEPVLLSSLTIDKTPIDWIWEGFLAKGQITLFSSLWKTGKTTLTCWLLKSIEDSLSFIGKETKSVNVLVISEESDAIWARRKEEFDFGQTTWVNTRPLNRRMTTSEWLEFLERTVDFCKEKNIDLVIIDTLSTFWPVRDENDAPQVSSALLPLNKLQEENLAVLLIHHDRKSGGEEGTASRGSGALPSYVDVIVEFRRFDASKREDSRRVIKTYSRYEETPHEIVIELTTNGYEVQGTKAQVAQQDKMKLLLTILPDNPASYSIEQLLGEWPEEYGKPPHKTTLYRWLKKLQEEVLVHSSDGSHWSKAIALQQESIKDATEEAW